MRRLILAMLFVLSVELPAMAQTFRGAINGTVTDPSGAVVPNAQVKAINKATAIEHATLSTSDGQFAFQDLPVGTYKVVVTAQGFPVLTVDNVLVEQGAIYTLPATLTISQQATTVEVSAAALTLDTTSETQTTRADRRRFTDVAAERSRFHAADWRYSGVWWLLRRRIRLAERYPRQPGQLADRRRGQQRFVAQRSCSQSRRRLRASRVSCCPIDAVDQFSVQTQAAPESGRNPGGTGGSCA